MQSATGLIEKEDLEEISSLPPPRHVQSVKQGKKKILFVASEFSDLIKVGGLGDVASALPRALAPSHDIRVLLPGYPQIANGNYPVRIVGDISPHGAIPPARLGRLDLADGIIIYVVICPQLYERGGHPYCDERGREWPDNHLRFALLGHAAAEIAAANAGINWRPQLVHAHDWPAAMAPAYMAWRQQKTPSVFTIHNLAHHGLCEASHSADLSVPASAFHPDAIEFYGKISFLKAGIVYADHVTTVSHTYASEITRPEFGCGLHGLLAEKIASGAMSGIVNGIDRSWDSMTDPHLLRGFASGDWHGKREHLRHIESRFGLEQDAGPLFAMVSRLAQQKGIDLTIAAADTLVDNGGRLLIMGRGEPQLEAAVRQLQERHPGRIVAHVGFNERDARRLFAASDFLLMPSRFEPCGLSQMYAQRFASLPIAHRTGGLADTIEDGIDGFLFDSATLASYSSAITRAINVYHHNELFDAMRRKAMTSPRYWHQAVAPYSRLYHGLVAGTGTSKGVDSAAHT